ncbi:MAG: cytochrome c3 family protein [bacterium]|nr:cytochrome c3 family protein [bacterium]
MRPTSLLKMTVILLTIMASGSFYACSQKLNLGEVNKNIEKPGPLPLVIVLDHEQKNMAPVILNHSEHFKRVDNDCTVCHHLYEPGDLVVEPCSACHIGTDDELSFKGIMHNKCISCHEEWAEKGFAPPVNCLGCHKKPQS